jgi:outer membrane protein assembly factor BamB
VAGSSAIIYDSTVATAQERQAGATDFLWGGNHGGPQRNNAMNGVTPVANNVRWSLSEPATTPAIADGTAYAGNGDQLVAVDAATGRGIWSYDAGSQLIRQPATGTDAVVGVSTDNDLFAVERESGNELWSLSLPSEPGFPTVANETIYIGTEGRLRAIDIIEGTTQWTYDATDEVDINELHRLPTAAVGEYVVVNFMLRDSAAAGEAVLTALEPDTGEIAWETEYDDVRMYPPAIFDGIVYVNMSEDSVSATAEGAAVAVSETTGSQQWEYSTDGISAPPAVNDEIVVIPSEVSFTHTAIALDRQSGDELWTSEFEGGNMPSVALDDDHVYLWADEGTIAQARASDGLVEFEYETGYDIPDPDSTPMPTPYGLFIYYGTVELLGEEGAAVQDVQSEPSGAGGDEPETTTETGDSDAATTPDSIAATTSEQTRDRGFLTNDDELFTDLSAREWTIIGAVISVAGVVVQAWIGD